MRRSALRTVARDQSLRPVVIGYGVFSTVEAASWIAILVYAYEHGGAIEVGVVACLLLVPAALLAPIAGPLADRFRRDAVLAAGYLAQVLSLAAVAIAMASDAHRFVVYGVFAAVGVAASFVGPAIAALLPSLAREAEDLSAANAAIGALENFGGLLGPLAAAALLLASGPAAVFAAMTPVMLGAFLAVAGLGLDPRLVRPSGHVRSLRASITGGVEFLRQDLDLLLLVSCVAAPSLLLGAIEVLVVVVATEQLGQGSHFAGYLSSAFGVGGLLGAAAAVLMIGRRGLALALCASGLLAGVPIALLSAAALVPLSLVCLFASGVGHSFGGVVGTTLIQRASPDRFRASVFGVLEGLQTGSLALGALLFSVVSAWLGLDATLLVVGCFVPVLMLLSIPGLRAIDAGAGAPGERVLAALRRDPIFAPLAPPAIEQVATRGSIVEARSGDVIMREGEIGDGYYCVLEGDLEVHVTDRLVRTLGRGDSFGEIALLHAVPRTATVSARSPATLVAVEGAEFLETVTRHPQSLVQANAGARRFLGED